jgi:hypothetical protein
MVRVLAGRVEEGLPPKAVNDKVEPMLFILTAKQEDVRTSNYPAKYPTTR